MVSQIWIDKSVEALFVYQQRKPATVYVLCQQLEIFARTFKQKNR